MRRAAGVRAAGLVATLPWRAGPRETAVTWLGLAVSRSWPAVAALVFARLTKEVKAGHTLGALAMAASLAIFGAVVEAVLLESTRARTKVGQPLEAAIESRIVGSASDAPLASLESPEAQARLEILRQGMPNMAFTAVVIPDMIGFLVVIGVALGALHSVSPVAMLLVLAALPAALSTGLSTGWLLTAAERAAPSDRARRHLVRVMATGAGGREVRAFGAEQAMVRRLRELAQASESVRVNSGRREALVQAGGGAVYVLALVGVAWAAYALAARGELAPEKAVLLVMLAIAMEEWVSSAAWRISDLLGVARPFVPLVWLEDQALGRTEKPSSPRADPPAALQSGIRVASVTFAYPGASEPALRDVELFLREGSVVALVGPNGAGKTTLVKLLLNLYEPTAGSIAIDGISLAEMDPRAWRRRCAGAFQDFWRPEFVLREAVGIGDLPQLHDGAAVRRALARAGSRLDRSLPAGLDTQLGASWPDGVDLSGGQWQQVALARGLMRTTPLLIILDEPTASLDPVSEHELFSRIAAAREQAAGRVILLVTHRFWTVHVADHIVVLDGGRVVEEGSHRELLKEGGLYARLFRMQAAAYGVEVEPA